MSEAQPNREQASYWDEQAGPCWVELQHDLDAELEQFGTAVMNELDLASGQRVLDVGCGAGATSLMLAERVHPGEVLGVDISSTLLTRARERGSSVLNLRFEHADAQTFVFARGSFDAVFSRFGVMFFSDPIAAFANLRTALREGGKLGFVCWRAMSENPSFVLPLEAALPFLPEPPAPVDPLAPGPFAFADRQRVREILERAGYRAIEIRARDTELVFAGCNDIERAVEVALRIGPLGRALRSAEAPHERIRSAVRDAFVPHYRPAGVSFPAATWVVTARS